MVTGKELFSVVIPNYIERIQISAARRPRYYEKHKQLPKLTIKLKKGLEDKTYEYRKVKNKELLFSNITNELVIANPKAVGTPKYLNITGNSLYSGFTTPHVRNLIVNSIKNDFKKYFVNKKITEFPIIFEINVCTVYNKETSKDSKRTQDLDNLISIYSKCTLDLMTKMKVIPDDNLSYIRGIMYNFIPSNERKLIIKCYKYDDINEVIITNVNNKTNKSDKPKTKKIHKYNNKPQITK